VTAAVTTSLPMVWHGIHPHTGGTCRAYGWLQLTWRAEHPHQVDMVIGGKPWTVAWELLRDGCRRPVGDGDIHVTPTGRAQTEIRLRNHNGSGAARIATQDLRDFVDDVQLVWAERDYGDEIDADMAALLNEPWKRPTPPAGGET
jgi:sporulation and cell division protein SsgA